MRPTAVSLVILFGLTDLAAALGLDGTCRGPTATVFDIGGLDTAKAWALAGYNRADAISYCHYTQGRLVGKPNPKPQSIAICADKFLREGRGSTPIRVEANCITGTLSISSGNWSNVWKMPLAPMCGDDNNQAISAFKMMCPGYEGKIENEDAN